MIVEFVSANSRFNVSHATVKPAMVDQQYLMYSNNIWSVPYNILYSKFKLDMSEEGHCLADEGPFRGIFILSL